MVLLTFFALSLSAQNRKVTGVVVDEFGDPLPGANITVVGNQNLATATNMEGQFTLNNVPKDAILNVRFIGYAVKTIRLATLKNNDLLRIVLSEDVKELNDVVVTALGISRESKSLGYARQSIDTESLLDTRDPNLLNSLSGKVSGVNFISNGGPLSSTRVEIRGIFLCVYVLELQLQLYPHRYQMYQPKYLRLNVANRSSPSMVGSDRKGRSTRNFLQPACLSEPQVHGTLYS